MLFSKMKGVHTPHRKHTAQMPAVRMPVPQTVTIPLSMHIGAPAVCCVKVGDMVKVGQPIATPGGFVSSPIHSSVSGKVTKIDDFLLSNGRTCQAVTIATDGEQSVWEEIAPPTVTDLASFIEAVKQSGVVGLGGAGFPTAVKFSIGEKPLDALVVNCAECEPYITSDTRTMLDQTAQIFEGIALVKTYLNPARVILGVEANKPECIAKLKTEAPSDVEICVLPSVYPQGGEKVLLYHTLGRIVPEGKLPIDVGAIVINCTTLAFIASYMKTGMPLVEKTVTVDGAAVVHPQNVIVPIGTAMQDVFDFCGGFNQPPKKVLYGGPMMGVAVPSTDLPVMKNTNAILALSAKEAYIPATTPCIRCGNCITHCPLKLNPQAISRAVESGNVEELGRLKVNLCMECGCCSFICPAKRPLVQNNKLGKGMLAAARAKEKKN